MTESLCCALKAITTLLIGYTPIENRKFLKARGLIKRNISWDAS